MPSKKKKLGKRKVSRKSDKIPDSVSLPSSGDPHRYGARLPLQPYDYSALSHHMQQYFEIDKDSEALNEGSYHYDIYLRCLGFNIEDNNLEDYNSLMDIVYTPYPEPDGEDEGMERRSDDAVGIEAKHTEEDCNRLHLLATLTSKLKPAVDKGTECASCRVVGCLCFLS